MPLVRPVALFNLRIPTQPKAAISDIIFVGKFLTPAAVPRNHSKGAATTKTFPSYACTSSSTTPSPYAPSKPPSRGLSHVQRLRALKANANGPQENNNPNHPAAKSPSTATRMAYVKRMVHPVASGAPRHVHPNAMLQPYPPNMAHAPSASAAVGAGQTRIVRIGSETLTMGAPAATPVASSAWMPSAAAPSAAAPPSAASIMALAAAPSAAAPSSHRLDPFVDHWASTRVDTRGRRCLSPRRHPTPRQQPPRAGSAGLLVPTAAAGAPYARGPVPGQSGYMASLALLHSRVARGQREVSSMAPTAPAAAPGATALRTALSVA